MSHLESLWEMHPCQGSQQATQPGVGFRVAIHRSLLYQVRVRIPGNDRDVPALQCCAKDVGSADCQHDKTSSVQGFYVSKHTVRANDEANDLTFTALGICNVQHVCISQ